MRVRITTAESVVKTRAASGPAGPKGDTGAAGTTDFDELENVPATFPPSAHTHPWGEITATPSTLADYGITDAAPIAHVTDLANPHVVTKAQVGLALVENTALSTWHGSAALNTVAQAAVTAHQAALSIAETQIPNGSILARVASGETITGLWAFAHPSGLKTDTITERTAAAGVTVDGLLIKDGGIPEGAVTAHEAALSIGWSQLTGVPASVIVAAPGAAGGHLRSNGAAWVRVQGVAWGDLSGVPLTFAPAAHNHAWSDITSGVPATFTPSAHTHAWADLVSGLPATWAPSAHVHAWGDITTGVPATFAPSAHNHAAGDINSGTLATARGGTNIGSWALGDTLYASATDVLSALAGNITVTRKFLRQVGNGAASAAPAWDTLTAADIAAGTFPVSVSWSYAGSTIADLGAVTTVDINGGTIDGAAIGASSATTGKFTTLEVTTTSTLTGNVGIGVAPATGMALRVLSSLSIDPGLVAYGMYSTITRGSSGTGLSAMGGYFGVITAASAITVDAVAGLQVGNATKGSGSTITTQYGIYISGMTVGATNWAVYTAGSTASYFGGDAVYAAAAKVRLDGSASGDTYITESSANVLDLYAGNAKQLSLTATTATVAGNLIVSGVGPHAIGGAVLGYTRLRLTGDFTSSGSSDIGERLRVDGTLTGAAGDTAWLTGTIYSGAIVTQTAAETIGVVSTVYLIEPAITKNVTAITAACTLYIASAPTEGDTNYALLVDAGASRFDGTCYIGDTANANCTLGLTINQGAADDQILAFRSSDVVTALTSATTQAVTTNAYATFSKASATLGGLLMQSLAEDDALGTALRFASYGGTATTTKSTAGRALVEIYASEHNGANALADVTADGNVFGVLARRGGADVALLLLDEDADLWLGGALTTNGGLQTFLANDSAGAGFRYVVVPNA
jgi:hypothetical protein